MIEAPDANSSARPAEPASCGRASVLAGFLVVAPGDMNEAKQLDALVAAAAELGDDAHVAIVGRRIEAYDVEPRRRGGGHGRTCDACTPTSPTPTSSAGSCAADVVVDLRFPHRGEVSGSLSRAMQAGKPAVVSATGTYLDVPDDAVLRVAPGPADPAELARASAATARRRRPARARGRGRGGATSSACERARRRARGYERAINETLALVRDPARKAMAIWGRSLVDAGITEDLVLEGFGLELREGAASFEPGRRGGRRSPQRRTIVIASPTVGRSPLLDSSPR